MAAAGYNVVGMTDEVIHIVDVEAESDIWAANTCCYAVQVREDDGEEVNATCMAMLVLYKKW